MLLKNENKKKRTKDLVSCTLMFRQWKLDLMNSSRCMKCHGLLPSTLLDRNMSLRPLREELSPINCQPSVSRANTLLRYAKQDFFILCSIGKPKPVHVNEGQRIELLNACEIGKCCDLIQIDKWNYVACLLQFEISLNVTPHVILVRMPP